MDSKDLCNQHSGLVQSIENNADNIKTLFQQTGKIGDKMEDIVTSMQKIASRPSFGYMLLMSAAFGIIGTLFGLLVK